MKSYSETKNYWNARALEYGNNRQATTDDFYMRKIEIDNISGAIKSFAVKNKINVFDIGCGDGFTTIELAKRYKDYNFMGGDYSNAMIDLAQNNKRDIKNIDFFVFDLIKSEIKRRFDFIYTTRCLINLPRKETQFFALKKISDLLGQGGFYICIENFLDGQSHFNELRKLFDLSPINIRDHNLFFDFEEFINESQKYFEIVKIQNISSLYYIISRIIYSKIAQINKSPINYFDIHHELGSKLPSLGNYGPIKMIIFKKK